MKQVMLTIRLWYFYLTYKGLKNLEVRKTCPCDYFDYLIDSELKYPLEVYECVSKTNWKQDLMKIPAEEREFFKQFVGKVGLKFTLKNVNDIKCIERDDGNIVYVYRGITPSSENYNTCLGFNELHAYLQGKNGYAWNVDDLVPFDKPKELNEFKTKLHIKGGCKNCPQYTGLSMPYCKTCDFLLPLNRAPQSWVYIEVGD